MKIAIVSHTFPKNKDNPIAAFLHSFVLGIKNAGGQPLVIIPYAKNLDVNDFPYEIISYKYIWPLSLHKLGYASTLRRGVLPFSTYLLIPFLFTFGFLKLLKVCKLEKVDIISAHWLLPNGLIAACVSKLTGIPFVVTLPGSDVYVAGMNPVFKKLANFAISQAAAVIADSPVFIDKIRGLGAEIKNETIIPYPVDVNKIRPNAGPVEELRKKIRFNRENIVILAVGRLIEKKGFRYLLKSMSNIIKKKNNVKLLIVGEGDLRKDLEELTSKENLKEYVLFAGSIGRKELISYYNLADIFVMPSIADEKGNIDDQPVALLEAMSSGLPVIATNFPGISMTVKHNVNGFLVSQKDVNGIRMALEKLVLSSKLRRRMGSKSREISVKKLSINTIGRGYVNLFKKILLSN